MRPERRRSIVRKGLTDDGRLRRGKGAVLRAGVRVERRPLGPEGKERPQPAVEVALGPEPGDLLPAGAGALVGGNLVVVGGQVLASVGLDPGRRQVLLDLVQNALNLGFDLGTLGLGGR
jgi:hypothetical protein